MIASLPKWIDWLSIQKNRRRAPHFDGQTLRLAEAIQFLNGPDFIPAESEPARVEFNGDKPELNFRFPTPRPSSFVENNVVHGRFYRCSGRWQKRPAIILLHGGSVGRGRGTSLGYRFLYPLIARRCNRAGFNAATLEAPYHFQRHSRQPGPMSQVDCMRMAEAAAQQVAEIRALTGWLLCKGCPTVALWGLSMGAWLAGMTVCHDARLAAVVMTAPVVHSNPAYASRIIWRSVREAWQEVCAADEALDETPFNLTRARPAIPKENILLVEGIQDLVTPAGPIEELWQLWGQPDIWRLPHGHISLSLCLAGLISPVLRWLAPRLDTPTTSNNLMTPSNQSIEPRGGSRFCQSQYVGHWRLPPLAHAHR